MKLKLKIVGLKKSVQSRIMITGIHAVPIYIESIEDEYKEKLKVLLKNINFGITDEWEGTHCFTTAAHGSTHVIDGEADIMFNLNGLFIYDIILDKAHKFLEQLGIKNLKLTLNSCGVEKCKNCSELWSSKYTKGMYQAVHNHIDNGELFSFVYFVKYDPTKDADLVFVKDMSMAKQNGFLMKGSPYTLCKEVQEHPIFCDTVTLDNIKEGDLVIFPSYLDHFVEEQKHDGPRITIAGNLYKVIDDKKCNVVPIWITTEMVFGLFSFLYKRHIKKRVTK
mgnify:FL=1